MLLVASLMLTLGQIRTQGLPKIKYEFPVLAGQREVVLGPKPYDFTLLNGYFERDVAPDFTRTGRDTGGMDVDAVKPGGISTKSLGFLDWASKAETLFDKPCILITTTGKWNQSFGKKPNDMNWSNEAKQQWWVSPEGKILRQYMQFKNPEGVQSADLVFGADSVQRRYTDSSGKTSFGELFPSCGMEALNDRFKPMIVDGKVVLRDKDFYSIDPLTGGIAKYSAHIAGKFRGEYLGAGFRGTLVDIIGPDNSRHRSYITDEGDMIRVDLSDEKFFVISVVPKSRLDEYGRPIRTIPDSKGGGR